MNNFYDSQKTNVIFGKDTHKTVGEEIKKDGGKEPASLCVICGLSNAAYKRPDGVLVVPITALKN